MKLPGREGLECARVTSRVSDRPRVPARILLGRVWCAIRRRHDGLLRFDGRRARLLCTTCDHVSDGLAPLDTPPLRRFEGSGNHALLPQLAQLAMRKSG